MKVSAPSACCSQVREGTRYVSHGFGSIPFDPGITIFLKSYFQAKCTRTVQTFLLFSHEFVLQNATAVKSAGFWLYL